LKKSELAPDHMESKLTHCCSYNHWRNSTPNPKHSYSVGRNYVTHRDQSMCKSRSTSASGRHRKGDLYRHTHAAANGHVVETYWNVPLSICPVLFHEHLCSHI
jgi:hypothetical protein